MCGCSNLTDSKQYDKPTDFNHSVGLRTKSNLTSNEIIAQCTAEAGSDVVAFENCRMRLNQAQNQPGAGGNTGNNFWGNAWDWIKNNVQLGHGQNPPPNPNYPPPPPPPKTFPWGAVIGVTAAIGVIGLTIWAVRRAGSTAKA